MRNIKFAMTICRLVFLVAVAHTFGCMNGPAPPPFPNESGADCHDISNTLNHGNRHDKRFAVIPEGEWIQANVHGLNIRITSKGMFRRCFDWGTGDHCVDLFPIHSGIGIGTPGDKGIWDIRTTGARWISYAEYPMDYTEAEKEGVFGRNRYGKNIVWRNDGLVVEAHIEPNYILVVDVYQIYVDGEKPVRLDGADDNAIQASWDSN